MYTDIVIPDITGKADSGFHTLGGIGTSILTTAYLMTLSLKTSKSISLISWRSTHFGFNLFSQHKNVFQWDAYHPLVDRIPAATVARGGGVPARGVYLPRYSPL